MSKAVKKKTIRRVKKKKTITKKICGCRVKYFDMVSLDMICAICGKHHDL